MSYKQTMRDTIKRYAIPLGAVLLAHLALACDDDPYSVKQCRADQGYALPDDQPPFLGTRGAPIRLVIFGDITCPYTERMARDLSALFDTLEEEGRAGEVELQFRQYPVRSPQAEYLARVTAAAGLQGNDLFWDLYFCLVGGEGISDETVSSCAEEVGLDEAALLLASASAEVKSIVATDTAMARQIGYPGVPGILLCGYWMPPNAERIIENVRVLLPE